MNWKQGLFRVWLVLSALWIAGVCVQAVPSVRKSLEAIYALDGLAGLDLSKLTDAQMLRFSVLPPPPPGFTLDGSVVQFPDGGRLSLPQHIAKDAEEFIARCFWEQRWSRWWAAVSDRVLWGFLPPAALLFLGYALFWVSHGFRRG